MAGFGLRNRGTRIASFALRFKVGGLFETNRLSINRAARAKSGSAADDANNDGNLLFVDYSATGLIGDTSDFTAKHFLANYLDDIAPLVGPGGGGLNAAPEPTSFTLLSLGLASVAGFGWLRRKT